MSLHIQRFPNEPIILFQVIGSMDPALQFPQMLGEVKKFKEEMGGHIYRIFDMTQAKFDFGQVAQGMADERGQEGGMNDPDVTTLMVASGEIMRLAVASTREQGQYGSVRSNLCPSLDAALAQARADIASK